MNRRGFFKTLAAATAGFTILPPAMTYERVWKATKQINPQWILNPEWVTAPYEIDFKFNPMCFSGEWKFIVDNNWFGPYAWPEGSQPPQKPLCQQHL